MIKRMSKVQIIGPKGILMEVIDLLQSAGVVHIESLPDRIGEELIRRIPLDEKQLDMKRCIESMMERLRNLLLLLPPPKSTPSPVLSVVDPLSEECMALLEDLEGQLKGLHRERMEIRRELSIISRYERILEGLAPLIAKLKVLRFFETIGMVIERERKEVIPIIEEEMERITEGKCQIFVRDIDEGMIGVVVTYPREYGPLIRGLLAEEKIGELTLPEEYGELPIFEALKRMIRRKETLPGELREVDRRLQSLSEMWYHRLKGWMEALESLKDRLEAVSYIGQTRYTFVIMGWIPSDTFSTLSKVFKDRFGEDVLIRELKIREEEMDEVPVYIKNPWFVEPFELFMSILPLPKYGSIDPTPYLAIFFPTFFGLILGDAGYGSVLFLISLLLRRRVKGRKVRDLITILSISALFAILFGLLFGEFFGTLGERLGLHPVLLDRMKALKAFLVLAIAIGVGHVLLGIVLSLINSLRMGRMKEVWGRAVSIAIVVLILSLVGAGAGYLPEGLLTPGIVFLVLLFPVLMVLEGALAPLEMLKTISNIMSYVRIMAIGTSSVILAAVANRIGGMPESVLLGVILASLVHALNILLGVFSPTIHSLRLHYVEFFSKFYQPGGRRYTPFRRRV